ncbi:hypothetical protein BDZ91DRAFT_843565 [Kalaharituber pfeilii]|nr:hypothetical protein BDZ91DRAFT_843565 [Kalaharituber pfeilii]
MAASAPDKTGITAAGLSTSRKGMAPAFKPTVVTGNPTTSAITQQTAGDLDTVSEAGILTPQTGTSTPTRNTLEVSLAGIARMDSRSNETGRIYPELTQIYTGCDEENMVMEVKFVSKASRNVVYAWRFGVAEDKIRQSPVLKSALQGWTGTKDLGTLRTTFQKASSENNPEMEMKVLTLTCPIPFSVPTSKKDKKDIQQQVNAVRDILMALHGRGKQIPTTYNLHEVEYRVMWAHWFQWVEPILTQIRLWFVVLKPKITNKLMNQRMKHKEVKSLLNISFIFEYFSRRYMLTMVPCSPTSTPSSFLTFNNDVYDFVIPMMEIQDHITNTIEDAKGKLRKLVKLILFNLTKSKSIRMHHPELHVKGFTPDWNNLKKSRCSPIMLGAFLQSLDAEFGHTGLSIASPATESARLWTTSCRFCEGMPWSLAANDSLSQMFETFQRVIDSVLQTHEEFRVCWSPCASFLPELQKALFTIEQEIEGFKLLISEEHQIDRILGPHSQSNQVQRQGLMDLLDNRPQAQKDVDWLEKRALELQFSAASQRLEFWKLSGYLRRTWDLQQRSPEVERAFINGASHPTSKWLLALFVILFALVLYFLLFKFSLVAELMRLALRFLLSRFLLLGHTYRLMLRRLAMSMNQSMTRLAMSMNQSMTRLAMLMNQSMTRLAMLMNQSMTRLAMSMYQSMTRQAMSMNQSMTILIYYSRLLLHRIMLGLAGVIQ